jgi:OFA family oxalate/formate antiporter-like MFS transporter
MVMETHAESLGRVDSSLKLKRWLQLIFGVICMVMIANLQYGWTLFVPPIAAKFHTTLAAVQVAFTIFVLFETWLVPVEGYLVDRFGPKIVVVGGGLLVAAGWSLNSVAESLPVLCVGQAICGLGAGAVYGTCVGNALKWFPDRRGLAAGITAAGFGAGSALTIIPISMMIDSSGYESTLLVWGLGQGLVVMVIALLLRQPDAATVAGLPKPAVSKQRTAVAKLQRPHNAPQVSPLQMARTPVFLVMYLMFVLMAAGGLFVTLDRILNGLTRPFFGWVSDRIGRENTMFIAFFLEAIGILALSQLGHDPLLFVILSGMVFFAWGEIYSLFPSTCADTYGWKFASANAGLLYTAKGTSALLVPLATLLAGVAGWKSVFLVGAAMNLAAAIMALAVLKPMRRRMLAKLASQASDVPKPGEASALGAAVGLPKAIVKP